MSDSLYIVGAHKDFVVFNDGNLSLDPITDTELERVQISHTGYASAAWSAGTLSSAMMGSASLTSIPIADGNAKRKPHDSSSCSWKESDHGQ